METVQAMLNHDSGLKALGGVNDMRALRDAEGPDAGAKLAMAVFARSLVKTMAGLAAVHRAEAVVFTGGIGEHDAETRRVVAEGLGVFGAVMDAAKNEACGVGLRKISAKGSRVAMYVVPAEEDRMIAWHVARMCGR